MQLPVVATGPVPTRAHTDDAGLDFYSNVHVTIPVGQRRLVLTGVSIELPPGHVGLLFGRSGMARNHGVRLSNGVGVIDAGYRGEVMVMLTNDGDEPYRVQRGDRVCQLVVVPFVSVTPVAVEALGDGDGRGAGGFGSSGQ